MKKSAEDEEERQINERIKLKMLSTAKQNRLALVNLLKIADSWGAEVVIIVLVVNDYGGDMLMTLNDD